MAKTRRNRRQNGAGYLTDQQFFNPSVLPPSAGVFAPVVSTAPTADAIRPVLMSTFHTGGRRGRGTRKHRGGFVPSVMGGFVSNAQSAIVPAALYLVYHTFVPKGAKGKSVLRSISRKASSTLKRFSRK